MHLDPHAFDGQAFQIDAGPFASERVGKPLKYGRSYYPRTTRAMQAVSLDWAGRFRRGGSLDAARVWLADARKWRTGGLTLPREAVLAGRRLEGVA